jgi:choline transport protein
MDNAKNTLPEKASGPINHRFDYIDEDGLVNDYGIRDKGYTRYDRLDMHRLGKRQEFVRIFRPLSALSFTVLIQATWECLLM